MTSSARAAEPVRARWWPGTPSSPPGSFPPCRSFRGAAMPFARSNRDLGPVELEVSCVTRSERDRCDGRVHGFAGRELHRRGAPRARATSPDCGRDGNEPLRAPRLDLRAGSRRGRVRQRGRARPPRDGRVSGRRVEGGWRCAIELLPHRRPVGARPGHARLGPAARRQVYRPRGRRDRGHASGSRSSIAWVRRRSAVISSSRWTSALAPWPDTRRGPGQASC